MITRDITIYVDREGQDGGNVYGMVCKFVKENGTGIMDLSIVQRAKALMDAIKA